MSQVDFYFGAANKQDYTCRLVRKALASGAHVVVYAETVDLEALDAALWSLSPTDFVVHCLDTAPQSVMRRTRAVLSANPVVDADSPKKVLLQCADIAPASAKNFKRVLEVVGLNEADRVLARQRWKEYAAAGSTLTSHDLSRPEHS